MRELKDILKTFLKSCYNLYIFMMVICIVFLIYSIIVSI